MYSPIPDTYKQEVNFGVLVNSLYIVLRKVGELHLWIYIRHLRSLNRGQFVSYNSYHDIELNLQGSDR